MDEDLIENDDRMDITDENSMDDEEEAPEDLSIKSRSSSGQDQVIHEWASSNKIHSNKNYGTEKHK